MPSSISTLDPARAGLGRAPGPSAAAEDAAATILDEGLEETAARSDAARGVFSGELRTELQRELTALLGGAADIASVGPETLLALLQNRMRDLDGQISTIMNGLNERTQAAEAIGRELSQLRGVQGMLCRSPYMNGSGDIDMTHGIQRGEYEQLCNAAGISPERAAEIWAANVTPGSSPPTVPLGDALNDMMPAPAGHQSAAARLMTRAGFDTALDGINQRLQDCNRGNELLMIKLQTVMDQRKQALTTTTNMLSTLADPLDRIAGNLV